MLLSYEEACFYYLLLKNGYVKEVDEWIDGIAYNNETLETSSRKLEIPREHFMQRWAQ